MFWCLVRLSTGALSGGLYTNPFEIAVEDGFLLIMDKNFDFSVGHVMGVAPFSFLLLRADLPFHFP